LGLLHRLGERRTYLYFHAGGRSAYTKWRQLSHLLTSAGVQLHLLNSPISFPFISRPHARTGHRPTIAAAAWVVLAGGDAVNARQQQFSAEMRNSMTRRRRRPLTVAFIDPRPLTASYISRRIARVGNTTANCPRTTGVPTLKMFTPLQSALPAEKIHRLAPAHISYQHIRPYWAFTRSDRRTDRSVRLVCPIGRSDDRIV